jgi:glutaredoxin 3
MKEGFLGKDDVDRQIIFEKVEYVEGITHTWPEVLYQIDRINDVLETPHTVVILSYPNAPELKRLKEIFFKLDATVRVQEIGDHSDHPYEVKVAEALAETDKFPVVFIDDKKMDSLEEIERKYRDGSLQNDVEKAGAMAEKIVWNAIHHNPLVVFSKSYCPYCKKAKETLSEIGAKPLVFELDLRPDGRAIQDYLFTLTGRGTVPNVFIKAKSIGGGDDTQAMYKSGELENALRKAGAIK